MALLFLEEEKKNPILTLCIFHFLPIISSVYQAGVLNGSVICGTCQMDASAGGPSPGLTFCTWVYSKGGRSFH